MKKIHITIILFWVVISCFSQVNNIKGIIRNGNSKKPELGITVILTRNDSIVSHCSSDTNGQYSFNSLKSGIYCIELSMLGYYGHRISNLKVDQDSTLRIDITYPCPYFELEKERICPMGHQNGIKNLKVSFLDKLNRPFKKKTDILIYSHEFEECKSRFYCKKHKIVF